MKGSSVLFLGMLVCGAVSMKEDTKHGNPIHNAHYAEDGEHDEKYDHAAVLGSEDEAEQFAHLSPEQAKAKLELIFKKMDANSDGALDIPELEKWIIQSFTKLNLEDAQQRMKTDDKDGDGYVTWDEYLISTYGMSEEELKEYGDDESQAKSIGYEKNKFEAADENKDGKLNTDEASAFLHPYDHPRMADVETDRVLADYDINKDGQITVDEYVSNKAFEKTPEEDLIGEKENFKHNDADGDGALNRAEILKWVSPDLARIANEEATHLFDETDKNKDGQLSVDEVKEEHEMWVGSEATDYGNLLHEEL